MHATEEAEYRLRLAKGYLMEAREDVSASRWRSCVDGSQLAAENAAKAALSLLGPVGRTHNPAVPLRDALSRFPEGARPRVEKIAECAELLGPDVHIESDYGDESTWRTPWELYDESDAAEALGIAEAAVTQTQHLFAESVSSGENSD